MATAPTPGAARRAAAHMSMTVDGTTYTVRLAEISAAHATLYRKETGGSLRAIIASAGTDPDIDTVATIMWLARRQAGDDVTYAEVADGVRYDADIEVVEEPAEEDPDSPEA